MTIDTGFLIGYAGWARIDSKEPNTEYLNLVTSPSSKPVGGVVVSVTSASFLRGLDVPTASSFYLPQDEDTDSSARSKIRLGYGVYSYSGEISFELSLSSLSLIKNSFFKRNSIFHIAMCDGENTLSIANCVWSNFNITGEPNSTVNISISFLSNNGYKNDMVLSEGDLNSPLYDETDRLIPYWQTGIDGIQGFGISFSRSVTPVYLNNDLKTPSYLKPGLISVVANVNCLEECLDDITSDGLKIKIGSNKTVDITHHLLTESGYNMSSLSDIGLKTYSWTSIANNTISNIFNIS